MTWQETMATWQAATLPTDLASELATLNENQQEEAFYQDLKFGTAGMRGLLGVGPNRMNIFTVRKVTEALARYIDSLGVAAQQAGVAISYDSRHYSPVFAKEAGRVLSQHGIKVYLFSSLRPTPELSFTVRNLKTAAGIMITASHNPKEYNGYKVYGPDGGQMAPEAVKVIVDQLADLNPFTVAVDAADTTIQIIDDDIDQKYLAAMKKVSVNQKLIDQEGAKLKLVYSPLHGTGQYIGELALKQAGFTNYTIVKEQAVIDGDFPTVAKPNPEEKEALSLAIKYATEEGADLVVASDPDADRLGAAVRLADGSFKVLSGNQIAAILVNYLLTAKAETKTLPTNGAIVTSIVSSRFAPTVAKNFGVTTFDVLTGFKYIAETIERFERDQDHEFLFGFEESFGYLVKPFAHDKDAIQALVLFAEVAAYYKSQNMTVADGLAALYAKYGYFAENTLSLTFEGIHGADEMAQVMANLRHDHPTHFGGLAVVKAEDFDSGLVTDVKTNTTSKLTQPQANVLKYWLADGSWVAARPSGTEPKLKLYTGVVGESQVLADKKLATIEADLKALV